MRPVALVTVLLVLIHGPMRAQDARPSAAVADSGRLYRSPSTAGVLGALLPGAGHVYAGEYANGVRYYYASVCGIGGGALAIVTSEISRSNNSAWVLQAGGVLLIGVGVGVWVKSALDAPRAASRANVKHQQATHLELMLRDRGGAARGVDVGLSVAW